MIPHRPIRATGTQLEPRVEALEFRTTILGSEQAHDAMVIVQTTRTTLGGHPLPVIVTRSRKPGARLSSATATNASNRSSEKRRWQQDDYYDVAHATKRISRLKDEFEKMKRELAEEYRKRHMLETKLKLIVEWIEAQD